MRTVKFRSKRQKRRSIQYGGWNTEGKIYNTLSIFKANIHNYDFDTIYYPENHETEENKYLVIIDSPVKDEIGLTINMSKESSNFNFFNSDGSLKNIDDIDIINVEVKNLYKDYFAENYRNRESPPPPPPSPSPPSPPSPPSSPSPPPAHAQAQIITIEDVKLKKNMEDYLKQNPTNQYDLSKLLEYYCREHLTMFNTTTFNRSRNDYSYISYNDIKNLKSYLKTHDENGNMISRGLLSMNKKSLYYIMYKQGKIKCDVSVGGKSRKQRKQRKQRKSRTRR